MPVSVYNPHTDSWTSRPGPTFKAHHIQCAVDGDRIVIGGAFGNGGFPFERPLRDFYAYYPNQNNFSHVTKMPAARARGTTGLGVYNGKWYVAGGNTLGHTNGLTTTTDFFDEFDPATSKWTILPNLPTRRDHGGVAVARDKLFYLGGQIGGLPDFWIRHVLTIDVYDFLTMTWTTLPESLQFTHGGVSPAISGDTIMIAGGEFNNVSHRHAEFFDVASMKLLPTVIDMVERRHGFQMTACRGVFYAPVGAEARPPPLKKDRRLDNIERLEWNRGSRPLCGTAFNSYWS